MFGAWTFYLAYAVNTLFLAVFMVRVLIALMSNRSYSLQVRTFRSIIPLSPDSSNVLRTNFLLFIALGQFLFVYFLCYLDFNAFGLNVRALFVPLSPIDLLNVDEPLLAQ